MQLTYTTTEINGQTVPAVDRQGDIYALATDKVKTVGRIRSFCRDISQETLGILFEAHNGDRWWMPLHWEQFCHLHGCCKDDPAPVFFIETEYLSKRRRVNIVEVFPVDPALFKEAAYEEAR